MGQHISLKINNITYIIQYYIIMSKHKSEDYKISAVNYYLDNDVSMVMYVIFLIFKDICCPILKFQGCK